MEQIQRENFISPICVFIFINLFFRPISFELPRSFFLRSVRIVQTRAQWIWSICFFPWAASSHFHVWNFHRLIIFRFKEDNLLHNLERILERIIYYVKISFLSSQRNFAKHVNAFLNIPIHVLHHEILSIARACEAIPLEILLENSRITGRTCSFSSRDLVHNAHFYAASENIN